jgi:hypothetical protein
VLEVEEDVYSFTNPGNGAGPLWCYGSTCVARVGSDVFISGLETIEGVKPLNNTRWVLYKRERGAWRVVQKDEKGRTREPCPLAVFPPDDLFLSANPTLAAPDSYNGPSQPQVLRFSPADPAAPYQTSVPKWDGEPKFTEHSYRAFAADPVNKELLLFQNVGYDLAHWSFRDSSGAWSHHGKLVYPFGHEYEKPAPIRLCYANVALAGRAAHFFASGDIIEPVKAWREYKHTLTGQEWDYVFRRLYYGWAPDITAKPFSNWLELANRESTAGYTGNSDLHVDRDGVVHVIWIETSLDTRLREKFFPNERLSQALCYARISEGRVVARRTLLNWQEGSAGVAAHLARFHVDGDGRIFVFCYCVVKEAGGKGTAENRIVDIRADGEGETFTIPLAQPLSNFMTATPRAGNVPCRYLDVYGNAGDPFTLRYCRIRIASKGNMKHS